MSDDRPSRTTGIWVVRVTTRLSRRMTHICRRRSCFVDDRLLEEEELHPLPRRELLDVYMPVMRNFNDRFRLRQPLYYAIYLCIFKKAKI